MSLWPDRSLTFCWPAGIFGYLFSTHAAALVNLPDLLQPSHKSPLALLLYGNILLAFLNLLPAFPMDGGRVLRALLSYVRPEEEATRTAAWMGRMLAISMGLYGLLAPHFMLVFFALFHLPGSRPGKCCRAGHASYTGDSDSCCHDHRVPHPRAPKHNSGRGESVAFHLTTGFSGGPRGPEVVGLLGETC